MGCLRIRLHFSGYFRQYVQVTPQIVSEWPTIGSEPDAGTSLQGGSHPRARIVNCTTMLKRFGRDWEEKSYILFPMSVLRALSPALAFVMITMAAAQQTISLPTQDGGRVCADLYGQGARAVVLAHGGRFSKESWQDQARALVSKGFVVLAIDFRGFGCSTGPGAADFDHAPFENDVLAAVRYLREHGAKTVSVVGGSFGCGAAGDASIKSEPGEIDRIVFLGAAPNLSAEKLKSRSLFIVARDDANDAGLRLPGIRAQYEKAPRPKHLSVVKGSAHAQFRFQTDQSDRIMREIVRFLSMP